MSMCVRAVSPYMYIYAIEMNTRPACTLEVIKCALFLGSRKEEGRYNRCYSDIIHVFVYVYGKYIYKDLLLFGDCRGNQMDMYVIDVTICAS